MRRIEDRQAETAVVERQRAEVPYLVRCRGQRARAVLAMGAITYRDGFGSDIACVCSGFFPGMRGVISRSS